MRINKYLTQCQLGSRRKVENLITTNQVKINNAIAQLSSIVDTTKDKVYLNNKQLILNNNFEYYILNKPINVLSSVSDDRGRITVIDLIKSKTQLFPVGRLDFNSTGLIIITNDGELAQKLTHPKFHINKTYIVQVHKNITTELVNKLSQSFIINDKKTIPTKIKLLDKNTFEITLFQGLKRQIREMCKQVGLSVLNLERISIGPLKLQNLPQGTYRSLTPTEVKTLKNYVTK